MRDKAEKTERRSARYLLAAALALPLLATPPAFIASAQAQEKPLELQRVEVTGYRIKRADAEGPSPLRVLDREFLDKSGASTVAEALRKVPANGGSSFQVSSDVSSTSPGAASVDLRGLGVNRTLVLINGRRAAPYGFSYNITDAFVDLSRIPLAAVERIEVLKDGASAIYGADAVGGVVNVILRSDYEGIEPTVNVGRTTENDTDELNLSILAGKHFGDTRATVALEHYRRDELFLAERDFSRSADHRGRGGFNLLSDFGNPGGAFLTVSGGFAPDPACGTVVPPSAIGPTGLPGTTGALGPMFGLCGFDPNVFTTALPEVERTGISLQAEHDLTDSMMAFAEFMYTDAKTSFQKPPTIIGNDVDMFVPAGGANPYGEGVLLLYRPTEAGPREFEVDSESTRLVVGLEGTFSVYDWEAALLYDRNKLSQDQDNQLSKAALQAALASGALNPFGGASNPAAVIDGLKLDTYRESKSKLWTADAQVTGPVGEWELPGGPVYFATGAQFRHEKLEDTADPNTLAGAVENLGGTSARGERDVWSGFVEFSLPATEDLEVQAAVRVEDYETHGSTVDPKLGVRYQAHERLVLRGSAGTAFRAPSLVENFLGDTVAFATVIDGGVPTFAQVTTTGNPDLDPEDSRFLNLGAVLQITDDLSLSADYWYVKIKDLIVNDPQYVLDNDPGRVDRSGPLLQISSPFINLAEQKSDGVDLDLRYEGDPWYGGVIASHILNFKRQNAPGEQFNDLDGNRVNGVAYPLWRAQAYVGRAFGNWNGQVNVNYRDSMTDSALDPAGQRHQVDDYATVDLQLNYTGLKNVTLTLGGTNVFDKDPPFVVDSFTGYEFNNVDPRGAFWYLQFKVAMDGK